MTQRQGRTLPADLPYESLRGAPEPEDTPVSSLVTYEGTVPVLGKLA